MTSQANVAPHGILPLDWIRRLARFGYASRSVVYLIIGFFAVLSAFGQHGNTDSKGALRVLLDQPFGKGLVGLLIVGMIGYVLWRFIQAVFDTDGHGWSAKGLAVRLGLLSSAFTYAVLVAYALSMLGLLRGGGESSSPSVAEHIASIVGAGPFLIGMMLIFAGVAIAHWYKAFTRGYARHFDTEAAPMTWVHPIAILGLFARGCVFAVIAVIVAWRLLDDSPDSTEPPGLQHALRFVEGLPAGGVLLATLGCGLMLFAAYSAFEAVWRRINVEEAT